MDEERIPKNLQGLFKFCIQAGDTYDSNVTQLDEEKARWLRAALDSMTVDVTKRLKDNIRTIIEKLDSTHQADEEVILTCLEDLREFVEDMDVSNDFVKIGGLDLMEPLLTSRSAELRAAAGDLLAAIVQNNPFTQTQVVANGFTEKLISIIDVERHPTALKKCLAALSCLVRTFPPGLSRFVQSDGFATILRLLQLESDAAVRAKAAFLLYCLVSEGDNDLKKRLVESQLIGDLIRRLMDLDGSKPASIPAEEEHLVACLTLLLPLASPGALGQHRRLLLPWARVRLEELRGRPEHEELEAHLAQLLTSVADL